MAAPQAQNELGPKESFYRNFHNDVAALREQMERLSLMSTSSGERNEAIDNCLADIDRLSHDVKDASSYLPAYDQRTYSEAIKTLSEKLQSIRNSFNPPKKFSFKARKNAPATSEKSTAGPTQSQQSHTSVITPDTSNTLPMFPPTLAEQQPNNTENGQPEAIVDTTVKGDVDGIGSGTGIRRPSFSKSTKVTISKHEGIHVILPISASHAISSGTVSDLRRCLVDLSLPTANGAPFDALYVKNIKDSLIVCGQVAGALHITGVENSVIVVACRQFRMHGSKNVDIYLHSTSRPIFEDCEGLRFAPLPEIYLTPAISQSLNQWDQIDDFKWLKAEPSPHFSILPEAQRVSQEVWRDKVPGEEGIGLADILKAVEVR